MSLVSTLLSSVKKMPRKLFGSRNDRVLKRMWVLVGEANALEPEMRVLCSEGDDYDEAFRARTASLTEPDTGDEDAVAQYQSALSEIRIELSQPLRERSDDFARRVREGAAEREVMPEAFAILREASRRTQAHRHFDCQLIGGQTLADGMVAEMRTGEGKTIVCHLAAYLKVSQGQKVHVVTVNDYLVKRDAEFATPILGLLGYSVGYIQAQLDPGGREGIRHQAYACNLTYGTASEFGFDYLRDNMKIRLEEQVQGALDFAIIDEVDSILIDEARTPLIISGPARDDVTRYPRANKVAEELVRRQLKWDRKVRQSVAKFDGDDQGIPKLADAMRILGHKENIDTSDEEPTDEADGEESGKREATLGPDFLTDDQVEAIQIYENNILQIPPAEQYRRFFIVQSERKQASITHDGVTIAQELLDVGSLYSGNNMEWPHLIENSLRAHKTYLRDRDYVVQDRLIIIVDTFTGRLMHGRQWSDGLHQSVEAKEGVPVKEETQTLATITIQNFFKLYGKMSGMTGTAMTEAEEFMKIYKLDVIEIPTNRPVNRENHNDKMYRDGDEKFSAIVEEVHEVYRKGRPADPYMLHDVLKPLRSIVERTGGSTAKIDEALEAYAKADGPTPELTRLMCEAYDDGMGDMAVGKPILVGTTSVELSEKLSRLLDKRYGIEHEVLNAKQHEREAEIVIKAGQQSLPTHGRSKALIGNVTIATNMAGRGTDIKLGEFVVFPNCKMPQQLPDGIEASSLFPPGITKCCIKCEEYDPATNCAHCYKPKIDPRFPDIGRKVCPINVPCGLHIIGTERHESRRIDNQLRGRSGRQGDPGSSRFFLSLQDDLLKLFMSEWMLKMMDKLGFGEGTSLEDKRLTKGIERAQRKVEERNFSMRKHLIEWDEPMDFQRKEFYRSRQQILEGEGLTELIFNTIDNSVRTSIDHFLGGGYPQECIAGWCQTKLDIHIVADTITCDDLDSTKALIRRKTKDEVFDQIRTSLGEYIDPEEKPATWDVGGLLTWAQRLFKVSLTQNQMRKMEPGEIEDALTEAARVHFDTVDLDGITLFLEEKFPYQSLTEWAQTKFDVKVDAESLAGQSRDEIYEATRGMVEAAYHRREREYPVEFCIDRAFAEGMPEGTAADAVVRWVNGKFRLGWTVADVENKSVEEVRAALLTINEEFVTDERLGKEIKENVTGKDREAQIEWGKKRFGRAWSQADFEAHEGSAEEAMMDQGRAMQRWELSMLEQHVLLRIYDQAWKDHLLEMDHLKSAIMQRPIGGDQTHPQSQYAIEGRGLFQQMWERIAARVTDIIFKVKAGTPSTTTTSTSGPRALTLRHGDATGAGFAGAAADTEAAMKAQGQEAKVETIRRERPKVGRNQPCPCGSGKKFKQCHGRAR